MAIGFARLLRLDEPLAIGLLLLGAAAGAPFLPKLAQLAKGNLAFAVGVMVLLMVMTVGYLPLVLPLLLEGVSVNPVKIARSLVLLMLLPLAVGLGGQRQVPGRRRASETRARQDFHLSLVLLIVLLVVVNLEAFSPCSAPAASWPACCFSPRLRRSAGSSAGPRRDTRRVLGLGTAQRNIAAALVVGGQSFDDPKVVVMVVVVAIVGLLILMPLSRSLSRRGQALP